MNQGEKPQGRALEPRPPDGNGHPGRSRGHASQGVERRLGPVGFSAQDKGTRGGGRQSQGLGSPRNPVRAARTLSVSGTSFELHLDAEKVAFPHRDATTVGPEVERHAQDLTRFGFDLFLFAPDERNDVAGDVHRSQAPAPRARNRLEGRHGYALRPERLERLQDHDQAGRRAIRAGDDEPPVPRALDAGEIQMFGIDLGDKDRNIGVLPVGRRIGKDGETVTAEIRLERSGDGRGQGAEKYRRPRFGQGFGFGHDDLHRRGSDRGRPLRWPRTWPRRRLAPRSWGRGHGRELEARMPVEEPDEPLADDPGAADDRGLDSGSSVRRTLSSMLRHSTLLRNFFVGWDGLAGPPVFLGFPDIRLPVGEPVIRASHDHA